MLALLRDQAEAANLPLSASGSDTPVGAPQVIESTDPSALAVVLVVAPFVLPIAAATCLAVRLRGLAKTTPAIG